MVHSSGGNLDHLSVVEEYGKACRIIAKKMQALDALIYFSLPIYVGNLKSFSNCQ